MTEEKNFFFSFFKNEFNSADEALDWLEKVRSVAKVGFIQLLNPSYIVSKKQLEAAVYHTIRAFEEKRNIARDKKTELIVRIAGVNQIKNAFEHFGVIENIKEYIVIIFSENEKELKKLKKCCQGLLSPKTIQWEPKLPINKNITKLMKFYNCNKQNIDEITKKAIEKIAYIEVL